LISCMDDVVDYTEAVSERLWLYKLQGSSGPLKTLSEILEKMTGMMAKALQWLKEPRRRPEILKILEDIHTEENRADQALRAALAELFENNPDPLSVMKWKEIYETAETATDKSEAVATIIEGILLKYG